MAESSVVEEGVVAQTQARLVASELADGGEQTAKHASVGVLRRRC